ncbi:MAG: FHA domain-containing protein [Hyphomicrobium sp.]
MFQQHKVAVASTVIVVAGASAVGGLPNALPVLNAVTDGVADAIQFGYRAAPALMLGLVMLVAMPVIALAARIQRWWRHASTRARRGARSAARHCAALADDEMSGMIDGDMATPPGHAYLEIVGQRPLRFTILRDMFRIGREDDNDIRISSDAVHRYHAAIHREEFGAYRITDLSGLTGQGISVNGERCDDAFLHDGDVIDLGPGRMRFHSGLT